MFSNLPKSLETVMFYLYHLETTPTLYLHNYTDLQSEALSRMNGAIKNYNRFTTKRLHLVINSDLQKHTMAHFSNHLTTLEVSFESKRDIKTMHLGWLLSHFPFLQVLYILNSDVILIGEPVTFTGKVNPTTFDNNGTYHNGVRVYLSLVKVSIRNSSTEEGLLDYIRYIAPNLTDIGWVAYQQEYKRHSLFQGSTIEWNRFEPMERRLVYDFDFSCFFLNIVNINICFDQGEHDVYIAFDRGKRTGSIVFTMDGNKLVKWRYSEKGDEQLEKRINIKCASCQKIRLNHTISLK
jgi:hypothetical protein